MTHVSLCVKPEVSNRVKIRIRIRPKRRHKSKENKRRQTQRKFRFSCVCVCVHLFSLLLRLRLRPLVFFTLASMSVCESRFRVKCFFRVDLCYILWSVLLHHLICNAPLLEINCKIGFLLRQCFSILFEFQVIRKGCIFSPFLPFVLLFVRFCCNSPFALELHRCSKGRSISRVQTENCYYF